MNPQTRRVKRPAVTARERLVVIAIILTSLALGVFYWKPIRVLAKPDEHAHLLYIYEVHQGNVLPNRQPAAGGLWEVDERHQPPLYYWVMALLARPTMVPDPRAWIEPNPFFLYRTPQGNTMRALTQPEGAAFFYAVRAASWLLGALVLAATYRAARTWLAPPAAATATATVGLIPSFLFLQGAANNSALAAVWYALAFGELLSMWRRGVSRPRINRLAVWLVLGHYTRLETVFLYVPVALLALHEKRAQRGTWRALLAAAVASAAAALPLLARNGLFHRQATPLSFLALRPAPVPWSVLVTQEAERLFKTTFITVGEGFGLAPDAFYWPIGLLVGLAALGLGRRWIAGRDRDVIAFLAAAFAPVLLAGFLATRWYYMDAPRYWLVLGTPAFLLMVGGYASLWPRRFCRPALTAWVVVWWALNVLTVVAVVRPLYMPRQATRATLPVARFEDAILLHKVHLTETRRGLKLTLVWEAKRPVSENWAVFVHAVGPEGRIVAQEDTHPLYGAYPTSWWTVGEPFEDHYELTWESYLPESVRVYVGLYRPDTQVRMPAWRPDGTRWPNDAILVAEVRPPNADSMNSTGK